MSERIFVEDLRAGELFGAWGTYRALAAPKTAHRPVEMAPPVEEVHVAVERVGPTTTNTWFGRRGDYSPYAVLHFAPGDRVQRLGGEDDE
jgi:hypothetical protein